MKDFYKENSPDEYLRIISNTFDTFEQDNTYLLFAYVFNPVQGYPLYLNGYGERLEYNEDFNLSLLYEASYYECESHTHTYEKNICSYCHSFQKLATPTISSLSNSASGITVKWNPVNNAKYYKIMRKEGSGKWTSLATISTNSYTDTSAVSGKTYTYQIACVSESDKRTVISDTTGAGKSIVCVKQPTTTVAPVANGVKISWTKSAGATGYIVYRKTASTSWARVAEISGDSTLTTTDTKAVSGTTYYYTVKAYKTVGSTTHYSTYVSTKALAYQKQPTTTVANAATGVKITWTKSAGATGYIVYRKTASTSWARVTVISGDSTLTTTDTKAVSGTTYYYTVKAYKTVGSTTYNSTFASSKAIVYQKQPTTTVANAATGVKISWTKSAGATGYIVYRKTASTSWARVAVISGDSTLTTTDTTAASGTTYYYTVKAYKTVSGTTYNSTFASTAALMYLKQPTVTLANVTGGVKITWTKSTGATSYRVYRKTSGGSWTTLTTLGSTATTYTDKTAKSGTTYYYTVKAITGSYASSFVTTKYIKKN